MALEFKVLSCRRDFNNGEYAARIEFEDRTYDYIIKTNAHIYYCGWLDGSFSILDGEDRAFTLPLNSELALTIIGLSSEAKAKEERLREAFFKFIEEECSEK